VCVCPRERERADSSRFADQPSRCQRLAIVRNCHVDGGGCEIADYACNRQVIALGWPTARTLIELSKTSEISRLNCLRFQKFLDCVPVHDIVQPLSVSGFYSFSRPEPLLIEICAAQIRTKGNTAKAVHHGRTLPLWRNIGRGQERERARERDRSNASQIQLARRVSHLSPGHSSR
jgi:hypothetical protein